MSNHEYILDALYNHPLAILPKKYDAICTAIETRITDGINAEVASKFAAERLEPYITASGVGVIPVVGVLAKRMNLFMQISGGTSTEILGQQFNDYLNNDAVKAILLDTDSPGGSVDGSFTFADQVYAARGVKPVVAFGNGMVASAGYLIPSSASYFIANRTAEVGSIGVIGTFSDRTVANERAGIKRTVIHSGRYKAIGSADMPLTAEGQAYLQSMIDSYYSLFVQAVARNRNASVETVLEVMADGRVFLAEEALKNGMIDQIGERADAIAYAESLIAKQRGKTRAERGSRMNILEAVGLVLAGKPEQIEDAEGRERASLVAAKCREHYRAEWDKEQAASAAKAALTPEDIRKEEKERSAAIVGACGKLGIGASVQTELINSDKPLVACLSDAIDKAAATQKPLETADKHDDGKDLQKPDGGNADLQAAAKRIAEGRK